jgi:methyltransferase (TIGR00027 family)
MPRDASHTAELAALARAAAHLEPPEIQAHDHLARRFVGAPLRLLLLPIVRPVAMRAYARRVPGAYGYVIARTHRIDEFVRQELEAGATQLVVLGAGYDSRAYRFGDLLAGKAAFEVDAPATLQRKREKVAAILGAPPSHVRYVPVDFDRETLEAPLGAAGYDPAQRTVFVWESVTFYITAQAVEQVLRRVAASGRQTAIIFDYLFRSVLEGGARPWGAAETLAFVERKGEPFTFGLDERSVEGFLARFGLRMDSNLLPDDLEARYLRGWPERHPLYRIGAFYGITTARVA